MVPQPSKGTPSSIASSFLPVKELYNRIHHELIPGFQCQPVSSKEEEDLYRGDVEHEFFLLAKDVPNAVLHNEDPVHSLVHRKQEWQKTYDILKRIARKKFVKERVEELRDLISKKTTTSVALTQNEIKFLELARNDPDPAFSGDYNWYYTGGCLKYLSIGDQHLLLSTQGKYSDQICMTRMEKTPSWSPVLPFVDKTVPEKKQPILQVEGIEAGNTGYVGVRLKNSCILYEIANKEESSISFIPLKEAESDTPLIGFDINSEHCCTVDTERRLKLWDLPTMRCIRVKNLGNESKASTRWNQVLHSPDDSLVVADNCSVEWWEMKRMSRRSCRFQLKEWANILPCEGICLMFPSRKCEYDLYLATTHRLVLVDTRGKISLPVQEWIHQMTSPPTYSHCHVLPSGEEVACIANQKPESVMLAVPSTRQLLQLVTLGDSLHQAQMRGECLDPFLNMRLHQSLNGITCLPERIGFTLLSQTAAGDVFKQRVWPRGCNDSSLGLRGQVPKPDKTLYHTGRYRMKKLYSGLKKNVNLPVEKTSEPTSQPWQKSKARLLASTDVLSPVLLSVWDIDECPEWGEPEEGEMQVDFEDPIDRVSTWLSTLSRRFEGDDAGSENSPDLFASQESML